MARPRNVSILLAILGLAFLIALGRPSTAASSTAWSVFDRPVAHCPLHCDNCDEQHSTHLTHYVVGGSDADGVLHGSCFPGSCTVHSCGETEQEEENELAAGGDHFVRAWEALRAASPRELPDVIRQHPQHLVFNSARAALQVLNCGGEVFAHIPLTASDLKFVLSAGSASGN